MIITAGAPDGDQVLEVIRLEGLFPKLKKVDLHVVQINKFDMPANVVPNLESLKITGFHDGKFLEKMNWFYSKLVTLTLKRNTFFADYEPYLGCDDCDMDWEICDSMIGLNLSQLIELKKFDIEEHCMFEKSLTLRGDMLMDDMYNQPYFRGNRGKSYITFEGLPKGCSTLETKSVEYI